MSAVQILVLLNFIIFPILEEENRRDIPRFLFPCKPFFTWITKTKLSGNLQHFSSDAAHFL